MVVILQDAILCGLEVEGPFREAATSITGSSTMMMEATAFSKTMALLLLLLLFIQLCTAA